MNQPLQTPETKHQFSDEQATEKLTRLYTGLVGLTPQEIDSPATQQLIDDIHFYWRGINRAHISIAGQEGSVDRRSFVSAWGSLTTHSLQVEFQTDEGPATQLVSQKTFSKPFEITPPKTVEPIREDYAHPDTDIQDSFDWDQIVNYFGGEQASDPKTPLYLVVFRSQRLPSADEEMLAAYDRRAHEAAKQSEALLYYFGGEADEDGNCLSFCLWSDRNEASAVSNDPTHQAAARLTGQMYRSFKLELYDLHKGYVKTLFVPRIKPRRDRTDPFVHLLKSARQAKAA